MLKIISYIVDFIFPLHENGKLVRAATPGTIENLYGPGTYEGIQFVIPYSPPLSRALITENKFSKNTDAARHLARILQQWLEEHSGGRRIVLIPIPLSSKRQRERGYNQVVSVLRQLNLGTRIEINENILRRTHHTTPQTSLKRKERLTNLKNAFSCDTEKLASYTDCTVIIIDDVVTTGATLKAARAKLHLNLPPSTTLICLAIAH